MVDRFLQRRARDLPSRREETSGLGMPMRWRWKALRFCAAARAVAFPAVAIRAVSDSVDEDLPLDMNEVFNDEGAVSIPRVLGQVARHPQALPGSDEAWQQAKKAAADVGAVLGSLHRTVAASTHPIETEGGRSVKVATRETIVAIRAGQFSNRNSRIRDCSKYLKISVKIF